MEPRAQTWDVLADVLKSIRYTREETPAYVGWLDDVRALIEEDVPADRQRAAVERLREATFMGPLVRFRLWRHDEDNYARLDIFTRNPNTYRTDEIRHTRHEFVVPVATYHRAGWIRWVFDRIASIELHETCESFFVDGERVYAPHHGNGWDPYTFWPGHDYAEKAKAPGDD